jgi:hypothetical protein
MMKHLGFILFSVALQAGCTTWETYDAGYDTSKGLATFHQSGLKPEAVYVAQVDESKKGWGMPTEIKLTPGEHVIGFAAHPSFYYLVPTDPNEKYNAWKDSVYHWVKFTAKANQDYEVHYEIKDGSLYLTIVEISSGNISSETIGNYVNLPDEYKVR